MLTYYKNQEFTLQQLDDAVPNCWINAIMPDSQEIEKLCSLGIPQDFVTYPLDVDERPRIEEEDDGSILIVVRIPVSNGETDSIPYSTVPLGIILAEKYIITVCSQVNETVEIFSSGKVPKLSTTKRYRFTLRLLMSATTKFLDDVRKINKVIDHLEDNLFDSMRNTELVNLFKYQKSFVYFTQALKQNELVLVRMSRLNAFKKFDEDEDLLQDVITENTQAIDMTNISSSILVSMLDAFASVISNNLNVVMKLLASVTIIMSIPNIITGFFGMNVQFPNAISSIPYAWVGLLVLMLVLTLIAVWIFNKKDWF